MRHLLLVITLCSVGGCQTDHSADLYASRPKRINQSGIVSRATEGYTGNIGGKSFLLISDGMGGYIGQIGDRPFVMISDGSGGYVGQIGDQPLLMCRWVYWQRWCRTTYDAAK